MKRILCRVASGFAAVLLLYVLINLASCSNDDKVRTDTPDEIELAISQMSLRQKVGQMFAGRPEMLDTTIHWNVSAELVAISLQEVNGTMRKVNADYPLGGVILYAHNISDSIQLRSFISQLRQLNGNPLLCIDEEGGRVARIADVNTNPENVVIGKRAFSDNPEVAAGMVTNYLQGLDDAGIVGCIKHFPGHGDTQNDTHTGYAASNKTWTEMLGCEMVTFKAGIRWGADLIMTAHIAAPNVTGSDVPSTLSSVILQDKLRGELGYRNIIVADAMEMGAITQHYSNAEAAVLAVQAGVDIILGPKNLMEAFDAVIAAVESGKISEKRINESVRRILKLKKKLQH